MHKSQRGYIILILAGLLLVALDFKVGAGKSYDFIMGEYEGVSAFALNQVVTGLIGGSLRPDILSDALGYFLCFIGFWMLGKHSSEKMSMKKRGMTMAVLGLVTYLLEITLPFFVVQDKLLMPVIIMYELQILAVAVMMYGLFRLCTQKIDNYKYMQVGKDLTFAVELYAICMVISQVLMVLMKAGLYFSHVLYYIDMALAVVAMFYYVVKVWLYIRMLDLFENDDATE